MSSCSFQHYFFSLYPPVHLPFRQLKSFPVEGMHFFHMKGVHVLIIHSGRVSILLLYQNCLSRAHPTTSVQILITSRLHYYKHYPTCLLASSFTLLPPIFLFPGRTTSPPPAPFKFCLLASVSLSSYGSCSSLQHPSFCLLELLALLTICGCMPPCSQLASPHNWNPSLSPLRPVHPSGLSSLYFSRKLPHTASPCHPPISNLMQHDGEECGLWSQIAWVHTCAISTPSCVTLDKLLKPCFSSLLCKMELTVVLIFQDCCQH